MGIIEEMQELQRKAERYNVLKSNYDNAMQYIEEIEKLIVKTKESLNPILAIKDKKERESSKGAKFENQKALEEQFNKLKLGMRISTKTIEKDYPNWNESRVHNFVFGKIRSIPKIQTIRTNTGINGTVLNEYFLDKTI